MAERLTIVDGERLTYKGLFDDRELFAVIDAFLWQKGYDKRVKKNEVTATQDHKSISVSLSPWKKMSEYVKHEIKVDIAIQNAKDETREIDGITKKMLNGVVNISFSAYLITDYEGRWEQRAEYYFLRTAIDKFVYKMQTQNTSGNLKKDLHILKDEIEAFLNLHRFT